MTDRLDNGDLILIVSTAVRQVIAEIGRLSGDQKDAVLDALIDRIQLDMTTYTVKETGLPRYENNETVRMLVRGFDPRRSNPIMRQ